MDVEEELDTHICLKCQKTIIGLDNYVTHKRAGCPSMLIKSGSQDKISATTEEPTNPSSQVNMPTLVSSDSSCQLKSDDFFLSLELKSSRVVGKKASQCQDEEDPKRAELESLPAEELVGNGVDDGPASSKKDCKLERKAADFMCIGGEDEDGEFEEDDDFDEDDFPPRGHTGGKWKPGMRPENSASWHSSPNLSESTGGAKMQGNGYTKKRIQKTYARGITCKCEPCDVTFARESGLVTHLSSAEHWKKSGSHPLHIQLILSHAEALAPLAPFRCSICAFYFNDLKTLVLHWVNEDEIHKAKVGQYRKLVCNFCKYQCWTTEEMRKHLNNVAHEQGVSCCSPVEVAATNELFCSKCNWACGRQQALFSHIRWKHSKNLHCEKCGMNFSTEAELDHHTSLNEHVIKGNDCSFGPFVEELKHSIAAHLAREHPKSICKGSAAKRLRGRPSMEELNKSKSNEELKDNDALEGSDSEEGNNITARLMLKPMPLSKKKLKILERIAASDLVVATYEAITPQMSLKSNETGVKDVPDSPGLDIQVNCGASSKDHTYYEADLPYPGEEEHELDEDFIIKQEDLTEDSDEVPIKRKRSKMCVYCCQNVANTKELKTHLLKFHSEKLFKCKPCCATFVLKSEFDLHVKGMIHRCNTKDLGGTTDALYKPGEEFPCSQCSYRAPSKSGIIFHELLHPPKTEDAVSALDDAEMDVREEVLCVKEDQVGNLGALKEEVVVADIESDGSTVDNNTNKSKKTVKRKKKTFNCPICQKRFSPRNLLEHLNVHTGEKPHVCSICQASFALKGSLASHQRSQHAEKRYVCPHCSYRSNRKAKLSEHIVIHEDRVREYTCDICGAGFYTSPALQSHMKLHLEDKGKRVACPFEGCNKAFRTTSEMVYHNRVHTGDKPFLCETCGYSTKSRHQLTKHERCHNGIKPFKCDYCSYSSSRSAQLRRHMRVHSCTKPYSCPHCNYTSSNQENLRKHVLKSKKHVGLSVYPCRNCSFGCNTANEMRDHTIAEHPSIAKQFDTEAPAFASLVTGIYNQKDDIKVPINTPAPYVPLTEKRDLYKHLHSKLQAKVDNYNLDGEMEDCSKHVNDNACEGEACHDGNNVILRVVLGEHVEKTVSEQNEVSTAVEYLMESTKRKAAPDNPSSKMAKRHCANSSDARAHRPKNDEASDDNSQLYQLLNKDAPVIYKQENATAEEPLNVEDHDQIAIYAIEFPNDQAVEQVITSDEQEEVVIKENTDDDGEQTEYQQNTIIFPFDAIEHASTSENEDQTVTIIQDTESFHTIHGTNRDGEAVIFYMPIH